MAGNPIQPATATGPPLRPRTRLPLGMVAAQVALLPNEVKENSHAVVEAAIFKPGVKGNALFFDDSNRGFLGRDIGSYERTQEFAFDLWLLASKVYEEANVINHRDDDNSGGAGYTLDLENNHLRFDMRHSWPYNMLSIVTKEAVPVNQWLHVAVTYDGSSRAGGIQVYWNGKAVDVEIRRDNLTQSVMRSGYAAVFDQFVGFAFGKRFRVTSVVGGAIDELRVFNRALTPVEVRYLHEGDAEAHRHVCDVSPDIRRDGGIDCERSRESAARPRHSAAYVCGGNS
jgi:hypothetical protein